VSECLCLCVCVSVCVCVCVCVCLLLLLLLMLMLDGRVCVSLAVWLLIQQSVSSALLTPVSHSRALGGCVSLSGCFSGCVSCLVRVSSGCASRTSPPSLSEFQIFGLPLSLSPLSLFVVGATYCVGVASQHHNTSITCFCCRSLRALEVQAPSPNLLRPISPFFLSFLFLEFCWSPARAAHIPVCSSVCVCAFLCALTAQLAQCCAPGALSALQPFHPTAFLGGEEAGFVLCPRPWSGAHLTARRTPTQSSLWRNWSPHHCRRTLPHSSLISPSQESERVPRRHC
jgi:hypothetical protein